MTEFKTYFNTNFRRDLNKFFETIPDESRFHERIPRNEMVWYDLRFGDEDKTNKLHDILVQSEKPMLLLNLLPPPETPETPVYPFSGEGKNLFTIQYGRLTPERKHLDFLDKETKELFGVALFFIVLIDMVCYTHYNFIYPEFQKLTWYPKLIGNCETECLWHLHPKDILEAMDLKRHESLLYFTLDDKYSEAIEYMKQATINFFNLTWISVSGDEFWSYCKSSF